MGLFQFLTSHGTLLGIAALAVIVTVHELGHFYAARAARIRIFEFSLGFGPTFYKKVGSKGVTWSIRYFPLGGFVHMHRRDPDFGANKETSTGIADGEYIIFTWLRKKATYKDDVRVDETKTDQLTESIYHPSNVGPDGYPIASIALEDVSLGWQTVVLLAGVAANVAFAAVCFAASFMIGFDLVVSHDRSIDLLPDSTAIVTIKKEKLAELARDHRVVVGAMDTELIGADMGVEVGDVIVAIDGAPVVSPEDAEERLEPWWRGESFDLTLDRKGDIFTLSYLPEYVDDDTPAEELGGESDPNDGMPWAYYGHGMTFVTLGTISFPLGQSSLLGTMEAIGGMWLSVILTVDTVEGMFKNPQTAMNNVSGPVGTVVTMDQKAASGMAMFLQATGLISLAIAAFNLLPLPALDGGQVILAFTRRIFGKLRLYGKIDAALRVSGVALFICFIIAITLHDIFALF